MELQQIDSNLYTAAALITEFLYGIAALYNFIVSLTYSITEFLYGIAAKIMEIHNFLYQNITEFLYRIADKINKNVLFEKEWLKTGDMGYFNKSKELILLGRKNNIIKNRGIQLNPEEIENYLKNKYNLNFLLIKKEKLILLIEGEKEKISKEEILKDLKLNFSKYKIPDKIEIQRNFERTNTGKIKRQVQIK